MDQQHTKIIGYRDLTQAEIDLMNAIKEHAARTEALVQMVEAHTRGQYQATQPAYAPIPEDAKPEDKEFMQNFGTECIDTPEQTAAKAEESKRLAHCNPGRWTAIGKTHFQQGFMALTRAVAQPTTF